MILSLPYEIDQIDQNDYDMMMIMMIICTPFKANRFGSSNYSLISFQPQSLNTLVLASSNNSGSDGDGFTMHTIYIQTS